MKKDQKWREFNRSLIEEAEKMNWGLYRNIRFEMAEFLKKEGKSSNALELYLEVLYLDQNGPENREFVKDNLELLREFPPFDIKMAFIASGIVDRVRILAKELKITLSQIKENFIKHNQLIYENLKLPLNPEKTWEKLEPKLKSAINKKKDN